jgi:hypothetical protein
MSDILRYYYVSGGCVLSEETLEVLNYLTRRLDLDCKKKILNKIEEDGLHKMSHYGSHPTFGSAAKFTTRHTLQLSPYVTTFLVCQQFCILFLLLWPDGLFSQFV